MRGRAEAQRLEAEGRLADAARMLEVARSEADALRTACNLRSPTAMILLLSISISRSLACSPTAADLLDCGDPHLWDGTVTCMNLIVAFTHQRTAL